MDFQGICDRLRALGAPGLVGADEPRPADPKDKKDKGRAGDPFVLVEPARLVDFLRLCRDDERLGFEMLVDLTATDPAKDAPQLWVNVQLASLRHRHRLSGRPPPRTGGSPPRARGRASSRSTCR